VPLDFGERGIPALAAGTQLGASAHLAQTPKKRGLARDFKLHAEFLNFSIAIC